MFLAYMPPGALLPLYTVHLEKLGFSPEVTAFCCATQAVAVMVASLLAGQVADRWLAAERCLAICALVAAGDLWLLAGLQSPPTVFVTTLVFWLVCGPSMMLATTIAFTHLPHPERTFGPVRMWGTAGWMVTGWLVGWWLSGPAWARDLSGHLRPHAPSIELTDTFRIGAVLAVVLGLFALTLPYTPPVRAAAAPAAPLAALRLLRGRPFVVYCLCLFGVCVTFPFTTQVTPLLLRRLGIADAWLMPTLTLAQASEVACLGLLPAFLLRLGTRGTMLLGLGAWLVSLSILAWGRPVQLVVSSLVLNGLCISGYFVGGALFVNRRAGGGLRASAQGLISCVNGTGMLCGHLLVGWLRQHCGGDLPQTFAVGATITALLVIVFMLAFPDLTASAELVALKLKKN
jgi:MFS family permease